MIVDIFRIGKREWVYELDGVRPPQNIASSRRSAVLNAREHADGNLRDTLQRLADTLPRIEVGA